MTRYHKQRQKDAKQYLLDRLDEKGMTIVEDYRELWLFLDDWPGDVQTAKQAVCEALIQAGWKRQGKYGFVKPSRALIIPSFSVESFITAVKPGVKSKTS